MTRLLFPALIGLLGAAVLLSLGVWQMQRLAWKKSILAEIDARIANAPVRVPENPDPVADRYLPVEVEGMFHGAGVRVLTGVHGLGSGYRLISILTLNDGRRVLVDRGFAPLDRRPAIPGRTKAAKVTGNLNWPDEADGFTPEPDRENFLWYARDVAAMAAELETDPILVVARTVEPPDDEAIPAPVTSLGIPNDHLEYAITWFGLAAVWVLMTLNWIARLRRGRG